MSCPSWKTIVIAHLQNVRAALRFSAKIWKQPGSKLHVIVASNLLCEYTGCPRLSHIYYRGWIRKQFCTSRCFQTDHRPRCYFRLKVFRKVGLFVSPRQLPSLSVFYISKRLPRNNLRGASLLLFKSAVFCSIWQSRKRCFSACSHVQQKTMPHLDSLQWT